MPALPAQAVEKPALRCCRAGALELHSPLKSLSVNRPWIDVPPEIRVNRVGRLREPRPQSMAAFQFPEPLLDALRSARRVMVLTGAGVSAASGAPGFRGAQHGLWAHFKTEDLAH